MVPRIYNRFVSWLNPLRPKELLGVFYYHQPLKNKIMEDIVNHLNSWGSIIVDCGAIVYSRGCYLLDTSFFSFGKKNNFQNLFSSRITRMTIQAFGIERNLFWQLNLLCRALNINFIKFSLKKIAKRKPKWTKFDSL